MAPDSTFNPNTVPQAQTPPPTEEPTTTNETPSTLSWGPTPTTTPKTSWKTPPQAVDQESDPEAQQSFGSYDRSQDIIQKKRYDLFQINTAVLLSFLFIAIGGVFFTFAKVNLWSGAWKSDSYPWITQSYKTIVETFDQYTNLLGISNAKNFWSSVSSRQIDTLITSSIPYIFKLEAMQSLVETLTNQVIQNIRKLEEINSYITEYGFIHPDIMDLLHTNKSQVPLLASLHTIETIKFSTAFNVFSILDTFIQQAAQELWSNTTNVRELMQDYASDGEADIANYLSMCYLNPYENLPACDVIGDFDNYIRYDRNQDEEHIETFKNLFALMDNKLENSTVPSLQILFNDLDPNSTTINFTVGINTLIEDEAAFFAKWILNPHVYIVSTLASFLRQSLFVIGDSIKIDQIDIQEQIISIGNIQVPIKRSSMTFNLPLQSEAQREVFDYYKE